MTSLIQQPQQKAIHCKILKGTPLTKITETGREVTSARFDFVAQIHQEKLGKVYFFLGKTLFMTARNLTSLLLVLIVLLSFQQNSQADQFLKDNFDQTTACILGEARSEGYSGMLAVAETMRRRKSLTQGIYGCSVKVSLPEISYIKAKGLDRIAERAWASSKTTNTTHGATNWENSKKFGKPYWAKNMKQVAVIRNHVFYK